MVTPYLTYANYSNESGFNQIVYPLINAIPLINPMYVILWLLMIVLTVSSYYNFAQFIGRTRFFNSLLASSFVTFIVAIFFSLSGWVTPYHVLTFIGITILTYIIATFYK